MKTVLREEEVIRFMTRGPQVHMMEIIGVNDIDLNKTVGKICNEILSAAYPCSRQTSFGALH